MRLKKMGYNNVIMESKRGKASPVSGCSMNSVKSQSSKQNPFCPGSSSWTTQSIVTDHMISHYKKIYSAKAAIDASVPKSLKCSVRYNDQIKRERSRAWGHPESAQSQRNCLSSCSSTQGRGSMSSRPRLNSSFHLKQIVYASPKSRNDSQPIRPSSEMSYKGTPEGTPRRQQSARSSATADTQSVYHTFQDPVQKTYGGDLLHKHSRCFTRDTPFAPKILKSDKNSYLSKYRYYTAPQTKPGQHGAKHGLPRQQTYNGSIQADEYSTTEFDDPPQGSSTLHQLSDDECNGLNVSIDNKQKYRSSAFHYSSTRASPEGIKSPIMTKTSAEEEELMYLKFLADVTNDILSKEIFADRVLDRVFERHIVMNRHQLDEGEMRHLLEVLRKDIAVPVETPVSCIEAGRNYQYSNHIRLPSESAVLKSPERKDEDDFPYTSRITDRDLTEGAVLFMPPHCISPERTVTPSQENTDGHIKGSGPPGPSDGVNRQPSIGEETGVHHGVNQHISEETGVHHGVNRHPSIGEENGVHHGVNRHPSIGEETGVHYGVNRHLSIGEETGVHHGVNQLTGEETGVHHGVNLLTGEETRVHHGVNQRISEETGVHHNKVTTVAFTEDVSQDLQGATSISDVLHYPKPVPNKYDEMSTELEDLGKGLSNTLHVSGTTSNYNNGTTNEKNDFDSISVSDDEF